MKYIYMYDINDGNTETVTNFINSILLDGWELIVVPYEEPEIPPTVAPWRTYVTAKAGRIIRITYETTTEEEISAALHGLMALGKMV